MSEDIAERRTRVGASYGLSAEQAARLNGETDAEIAADVEALFAAFPNYQRPAPRTPTPLDVARLHNR